MVGTTIRGYCKLDMFRYPFEEHTCLLYVTPVKHTASELILKVTMGTDSNLYGEHGEWELVSSKIDLFYLTAPISQVTVVALEKTLTYRRRHLFFLIHSIVPLCLFAALGVVIFLVPIDSGERISFSVSVLLAFVFFTSSLLEELPHSSLSISFFSIGIMLVNIITTAGVISSVILCRMERETISPVPKFLKKLTVKYILYHKNSAETSTPVEQFIVNKNSLSNTPKTKSTPCDEISHEQEIPNIPWSDTARKPLNKTLHEQEVPNIPWSGTTRTSCDKTAHELEVPNVTWPDTARMFDRILFYTNMFLFLTLMTVYSIICLA